MAVIMNANRFLASILRFAAILLLISLFSCTAPLDNVAPDEPVEGAFPSNDAITTVLPTDLPVPTLLPVVPERRRFTLEWPETIRVGDGDVVRLTLEVDQQGNLTPTAEVEGHTTIGEVVDIPNLYDTHNVLAEASLDLAGLQVTPDDLYSQTLLPGRSVTFYWSLSPEKVGTYRGAVSLSLRFIPKAREQEASQTLIASQLIEIRAVDLFGLSGAPARILGGLGTVVGSMISLDTVLPWLWKRVRKKNGLESS